jgi:membrane-bound lytic murein transglycosylase F
MRRKVVALFVVPLLFVVISSVVAIVAMRTAVVQGGDAAKAEESESIENYLISPYDKMFQEVGAIYGIDWLLLSAIARAESEFRFDAVSSAGAVGIMQVMPLVAKNMGYDRESLFDPRICTEVAAKLLHENNEMLHLPQTFDGEERLKFILACYNAGYSRIADARRLTRFYGGEVDSWNEVSDYMELLAIPEFAAHEVVTSGLFNGSEETKAYVSKVMHIYRLYKMKLISISK